MDPSRNAAYFLGFEGEQTGPYSFADVVSQISQGKLNPETLVWWEGESDWQIISTTSPFDAEFQKLTSSPRPVAPPAPLPLSATASSLKSNWLATYAKKGAAPRPTYSKQESSLTYPAVIPLKWAFLVAGIGLIGLITWGFLSVFLSQSRTTPSTSKASQRKKLTLAREKDFSEASENLLLEPEKAIQTFNRLIDERPTDDISKQAIETLLGYYKKNKSYAAAGQLCLKIKNPSMAAEFFLKEPSLAPQAEKALFEAHESSSGKTKADFLIKDIEILINPLQNLFLAKKRIDLFEKTFPALPHPFNYYKLSSSEQIRRLFPGLVATFSDMLLTHMKDEFPQIIFTQQPGVEVKKDVSEHWRLIGSYRGDISLRNDELKNIYFIYWLVDNQWILVDTNLTPERSKFAAQARKRYQGSVYTSDSLISTLESVFKQKFPELSLHESSKASSSRP